MPKKTGGCVWLRALAHLLDSACVVDNDLPLRLHPFEAWDRRNVQVHLPSSQRDLHSPTVCGPRHAIL